MAIVTLDDNTLAATWRTNLNAMFVELFQLLTGKAGGGTIIGGTLTTQALNLRANATDLTSGQVNVLDTLEATDTDTAAFSVKGGVAVKKNLRAKNIFVTTPTSAAGAITTVDGAQTLSSKIMCLVAGTVEALTAPLYFLSGPLMTVAEVGALEFLADKLYFTITTGAVRKEIALNDSFFGGFFSYDKAATLIIPIDTASVYHAVRSVVAGDIVTGILNGFTFNQGRQVDADIANIKDGAGGKLQIECSAPHNLTTGDFVCITKENRVVGNNKVTKITKVDATQFICDNIDYAGGTQTSTAVVSEPAYLQAGAASAGSYQVNLSCAFTTSNGQNIKIEVNVGSTPADNCVAQRVTTAALDTISSNGNVAVAAGDRIFLTIKNIGGTAAITVTHCNLNLSRL